MSDLIVPNVVPMFTFDILCNVSMYPGHSRLLSYPWDLWMFLKKLNLIMGFYRSYI